MFDGLDFGTIMELANGIASSFKRGEDKQGGLPVDPKKLGMVLASFAGKQIMARAIAGRQRKVAELEEAIAILRERAGIKPPKKRLKLFPIFAVGAGLGTAIYVALLKPEERAQLFSYIDKMINDVSGLIGEIQGKPYTADYEKNRT